MSAVFEFLARVNARLASPMIVCAWCARERASQGLGPKVIKPGSTHDGLSHGICAECSANWN